MITIARFWFATSSLIGKYGNTNVVAQTGSSYDLWM